MKQLMLRVIIPIALLCMINVLSCYLVAERDNPFDTTEIAIRQGSTDIANGGNFSIGTGALFVDKDVTFTVYSLGRTLSLGSVELTGDGSYTIYDQPESTVAWGNSTTFTIRFHPGTTGFKNTSLSLASNDVDENPFNITITGTAVNPYVFADTGQVKCYDTSGSEISPCNDDEAGWPRQDGFYANKPNARSFTGPTQHPTYTSDYTTKDNVTGLVWKSCSEGLSGSSCAPGNATTYSWSNAIAACTALNTLNGGAGYAGRTTWRLPDIYELKSLINFATISPAINTGAFPATSLLPISYWSSSTKVASAGFAWYVHFLYGQVNYDYKTNNNCVRCVADGP